MFGLRTKEHRTLLPADEFEAMGRRLDKWVDSVLGEWPAFTDAALRRLTGPTLDVEDKGDRYLVKADIPGMRKEDIKVSVQGSILSLEGRRESEEKEEKKGYYRSERFFGEFKRVVELPGAVDQAKADAKYADGVLTLTLPKAAPKGEPDGGIQVH